METGDTIIPEVRDPEPRELLERFFRLSEHGTSIGVEIIAGVATWLTMSYILFLNPLVLGSVTDRTGQSLSFAQVLTVTALVAGVTTIAMGLVANRPFALAAGVGLNSFVAFTLVGALDLTWTEAMGVVVIEGLAITFFVALGFRDSMVAAVPLGLRRAIGAGTGLFIAVIGLVNAGVIVRGEGTIVAMSGDLFSYQMLVFLVGLAVIIWMMVRGRRGAIPIGIVVATIVGIGLNHLFVHGHLWRYTGAGSLPSNWFIRPDFSLVGKFSMGVFGRLGLATGIAVVVALMLADFFDSYGTVTGQAEALGDEDGMVPGMDRVLLVDSLAAVAGGACSASTNTTFIESGAGISEGGRTGLTAVVVGLLFLASMFLAPIAAIVPPEAVAAALVVVGYIVAKQLKGIEWSDPGIGIPALLTIALMPLTFSITNGIGAGIIAYTVIAVLRGRVFKVHLLMYVLTGVFAWYFLHGLLA